MSSKSGPLDQLPMAISHNEYLGPAGQTGVICADAMKGVTRGRYLVCQ